MNSIELSKNSWHYEIAGWANGHKEVEANDICGYTRLIIIGLLNIMALILLSDVALYVIFKAVLDIGFTIMVGSSFMSNSTVIVLIISGLYFCVWVYEAIDEMLLKRRIKKEQAKWDAPPRVFKVHTPGYFSTMYSGWKEKYCTFITFK